MSHPLENLGFRTLFDAMADAMLVMDEAGRVVLSNPAAHSLFGYAEDEICGMSIEALVPERYREHHRRHRDSYATRPEKRPMSNGTNLAALNRDGHEFSVNIGLTPLAAEGHSYVLATFHSIDRRQRAEKALRASEERLRLAQRTANLGIFDRDLTCNKLHWDERSREIWGLSADEEVTYEKFLAGIHPEDRALRQAAIDRALSPQGSGEYRCEFRVIRSNDATVRWVSTRGRVFFEEGRPVRILGMMQDITGQKTAERKLQDLRTEMETLLKQQVAMQTASAIAHELNQPMAAISAYSEVVLHVLESSPMDAQRLQHAARSCAEQAQRAGKSLHELLRFLQKGGIEPEPVDLGQLVQEAVSITRNDGYVGFSPVLDLERDISPVICNPLQVQKVLVILLRNGVEAMRDAGIQKPDIKIRIHTHPMAGRKMAQITVQDSGPGLDAETSRRIFEPFFTTKPRGIGMGLAISRALIEANGGQFWFDAEAGPGATFHFTLPLAS